MSFVFWFTGLSGSGKTTLADLTYDYLKRKGHKVEKLDGDRLRAVFPNTGFSKKARIEHIKKAGFIASILEKNGVIVIASFISPHEESRKFVRNICKNFKEIYVSASLEECERRDVKGLYSKARQGKIKKFTGIDDPYEVPINPDLMVNTEDKKVQSSFADIKKFLKSQLK